MARQFNGRLTLDALRERLAGETARLAGVQAGAARTAALTTAAALEQPTALAAQVQAAASASVPGTDLDQVTDWLTRLHLLNGVPYNYLVPDIGMLPAESIRFFQVDDNWIEALLDGAFSIGFAGATQNVLAQVRPAMAQAAKERALAGEHRQALLANVRPRTATLAITPGGTPPLAREARSADHAADALMEDLGDAAALEAFAPETLTGFLLRSAVVAGWPGMEVHGFSDTAGTQKLDIVRLEMVAPSLLFCLFAGVVQRVDLQEPSEAVHFGVDPNGTAWQKDLRYANGTGTVTVGSYIPSTVTPHTVAVPLRGTGTPAVLQLDPLAQSMGTVVWTTPPPADTTFTAAQFALEMVEGVQAVSFQLTATS